MSLRSARTRRAYAGDLRAWLAWLAEREIDVLAAGRVHADLWVAGCWRPRYMTIRRPNCMRTLRQGSVSISLSPTA
jgi:hypothetical protein